jgi:hypothetical protein
MTTHVSRLIAFSLVSYFMCYSAFGPTAVSTKAIGKMARHTDTARRFDRMDPFDMMENGRTTNLFVIRRIYG